jgi:hypothetical protein
MNPDFNTFWHWLMQECRDFLRLGEQLKAEQLEAENKRYICHVRPLSEVPAANRFRICPSNEAGIGVITTANGNPINFGRALAEATWHRYHGLRQTALRLQSVDSIKLPGRIAHRMSSSYVRPGPTYYPQNWTDCPNPFRAPAFIAAAIHCYCRSYPRLGLNLP